MNYEKAWKDLKTMLQIGLSANNYGLFDFSNGGTNKTAKTVFEAILGTMNDTEKLMKKRKH